MLALKQLSRVVVRISTFSLKTFAEMLLIGDAHGIWLSPQLGIVSTTFGYSEDRDFCDNTACH